MAGTISLTLRQRLSMALKAISSQTFPTDPASFAGKFLGGIIPAGGESVPRGTADYLEAYSKMPWLRAVAARVGYDVGATEWRMFVGKNEEGKRIRNYHLQRAYAPNRDKLIAEAKDAGEIEQIQNHPLLTMLSNANAVQTGLAARKVTQLHLDLVGEAFWLLEKNELGVPHAFWPVPPSWVINTPTPSRPYFVLNFRGWRGEVPVSEILWFCDPDPLNPYGRGSGTAQALGDELETDEYASKHVKNFYLNRARPDLIVWPKGGDGLKEEQVERLEHKWVERRGGFWNAFKPFFLGREVEVKELSSNFQSQQLVELRKFERDTMMQVYGVSPEVLGVVIGSNRATAMMSEAIYQRRVLVPRLELMRTVMQERLAPLYDERIILNYESPVIRDAELELQAAEKMPAALMIDEWRQLSGFRPLPGDRGKVHIGPVRFGVVSALNDPELEIETPSLEPGVPQAGQPPEPEEPEEPKEPGEEPQA